MNCNSHCSEKMSLVWKDSLSQDASMIAICTAKITGKITDRQSFSYVELAAQSFRYNELVNHFFYQQMLVSQQTRSNLRLFPSSLLPSPSNSPYISLVNHVLDCVTLYAGASPQFFRFVGEIRHKIFGELFHQMHITKESEFHIHYLHESYSLMLHVEFLP